MPDTYIKNANTWSKFKKAFIKNSGTWSEIKTIWIKDGGVWSKSFVNETIVNLASQNNINLKTLYTNQTGSSPSSAVRVIYNINGNIGSTSRATPSLVTDTWPAGSEIFVNIGSGVYVAGAGGGATLQGGSAISLGHNVTIVNNGVIAGGGGGGGSASTPGSTPARNAIGGTGAGLVNGSLYAATNGTTVTWDIFGSSVNMIGGNGGALGSAGSASGGTYAGGPFGAPAPTRVAAGGGGLAIALNTYTATRPVVGTVIGSVS